MFQCLPTFRNIVETKFAFKKAKMFLNKFKNMMVLQATVCFHMFYTQPVVDASSGFYHLDACHQVASSLLGSPCCTKSL